MTNTEKLEERLARLEELCYFQETALKELNDALTSQQSQVDVLERTVALADEKIAALTEQLGDAPANTLPPHHLLEKY